VAFDDVEIDLERRLVRKGGEYVPFSRTEWHLLEHLAANAGKVILHVELLSKVWGPEYRDDTQYLRVWVSRVRRKLGAKPGEPGRIKTYMGIGYRLDVDPNPSTTEGEAEDAREPVGVMDAQMTALERESQAIPIDIEVDSKPRLGSV
jgi:DNA-binding winged helix-turn-helix (wHTH) protein